MLPCGHAHADRSIRHLSRFYGVFLPESANHKKTAVIWLKLSLQRCHFRTESTLLGVVFTISIKNLLAGHLQIGWSAQGPVRAGVRSVLPMRAATDFYKTNPFISLDL